MKKIFIVLFSLLILGCAGYGLWYYYILPQTMRYWFGATKLYMANFGFNDLRTISSDNMLFLNTASIEAYKSLNPNAISITPIDTNKVFEIYTNYRCFTQDWLFVSKNRKATISSFEIKNKIYYLLTDTTKWYKPNQRIIDYADRFYKIENQKK